MGEPITTTIGVGAGTSGKGGMGNTFDKLTGGLFANPDSGDPPISASRSLEEQMQIYLRYLPQLQAANARAQLEAAQSNQPQYNQLMLEQLQRYGLPTAGIQQQIAASNAQAGARSNLALLQGAGGQAAQAANALNRQLNPEYFNLIGDLSRQGSNLVNSINLNGLSGGEAAAVERANNQQIQGTGNLGLRNNTNTIANAMNFGGAFNSKLGILGNALGAANNVAQVAQGNGGVNPVQVALGTGQTNTGNVSSFQNPQFSTQGSDVAQSLFGGINSTANQQNQLRNQFNQWDSERGKLDSWAQNMSGMCCFIFLEAYNGKLPWYVRQWRDYFYLREPSVATGYKRMANWLVPLMRRYKIVRQLVNWTMVKPITGYGGYLSWVNEWGILMKPFKSFWFLVWRLYGNA